MHSYKISAYQELLHFLRSHRAATDNFTHTSIAEPLGSFNIPTEKEDEFYNLYYQACFVEKAKLFLTEKPIIESCPFRIDMDFRFRQGNLERQYTLDDLKGVMKKFMQEITKWTTLQTNTGETSASQRICCIFEKELPRYKSDEDLGHANRVVKDGVHLMWPFLVSDAFLQEIVRRDVVKNIDLSSMNLTNTLDDVFDPHVIFRNNWQLYGSRKPGHPSYRLTHMFEVYDNECITIDIPTFLKNNGGHRMLVHYLKIRRPENECVKIKSDKQESFQIRKEQLSEYQRYQSVDHRRILKLKPVECDSSELELISKLVMNCLSISRATDYKTWIELGWCLYNIHNVDDTLLNVWIKFSQKSEEYRDIAEESCVKEWNKSVNGGLQVGTLHFWARSDNLKKYQKIMRTFHKEDFTSALSDFNEFEIAKLMHKLYSKSYICVSIKDNRWYMFDGIRWILSESGIHLRRLISTELWNHLTSNYAKSLQDQRDMSSNSEHSGSDNEQISNFDFEDACEQQKKLAKDLENAKKKCIKLKKTAFKSCVMKECAEVFHDFAKEFCNKLDSNVNIIGFENGVYELDSGIFRNGRSEDYLTMTTKIDYIEYYDDHPIVLQIHRFLSQIYTNKNVRNYVLRLLASFLGGSVKEEKFPIWTGCGSNGKSKIIELLKGATGDYFGTLPITILTRKRSDAGSANPHMAQTRGKRILVMQEPDTETKINVGLMKEYSGGDPIVVRQLYSEPMEFKPQFHMVLVCNDMPKLPPEDKAVWRRVRVTQHRSKFKDNPNRHDPLEFERDLDLSDKMKEWYSAFMWILLQKYPEYLANGLEEPDEVLEYTKQYQQDQDHVAHFIGERIQEDDEGTVLLNELYNEYKYFVRNNYPNLKPKSKMEFSVSLTSKLGKFSTKTTNKQKQGWSGYKLVTQFQIQNEEKTSEETNNVPCQINP